MYNNSAFKNPRSYGSAMSNSFVAPNFAGNRWNSNSKGSSFKATGFGQNSKRSSTLNRSNSFNGSNGKGFGGNTSFSSSVLERSNFGGTGLNKMGSSFNNMGTATKSSGFKAPQSTNFLKNKKSSLQSLGQKVTGGRNLRGSMTYVAPTPPTKVKIPLNSFRNNFGGTFGGANLGNNTFSASNFSKPFGNVKLKTMGNPLSKKKGITKLGTRKTGSSFKKSQSSFQQNPLAKNSFGTNTIKLTNVGKNVGFKNNNFGAGGFMPRSGFASTPNNYGVPKATSFKKPIKITVRRGNGTALPPKKAKPAIRIHIKSAPTPFYNDDFANNYHNLQNYNPMNANGRPAQVRGMYAQNTYNERPSQRGRHPASRGRRTPRY